MTEFDNLPMRLDATRARIDAWRVEARALAVKARDAVEARTVDPELLVFVEQTAGTIYEEIEELDRLTAIHASSGPAEAKALAGLGDSIRLVLLEITEQGTKMYSARSMGEDPRPLMGVSLQKAYEILQQSGHINLDRLVAAHP